VDQGTKSIKNRMCPTQKPNVSYSATYLIVPNADFLLFHSCVEGEMLITQHILIRYNKVGLP
jgi:hypothetical protein